MTTQINIKQKPILVIKPIRSSVEEGSPFNVNCYVTNKKDAYIKNGTDIKMCVNKTEIKCQYNSNHNFTCNFTAASNVTVECKLRSNCSSSSSELFSAITVLKKGRVTLSLFLSLL